MSSSTAPTAQIEDVQGREDTRGIALDRVGVTDLRYPIVVLDRAQQRQHTIATLTMSVNLPHHFKGTHMSRFLEVLNAHRGEVTMRTMPDILRELKSRLDAESARIEVRFPYFMERAAPVSGAVGLMDYECSFVGEVNGRSQDFVLGAKIPVTSLCPCSKAIADFDASTGKGRGAHNQRGHLSVEVRAAEAAEMIWIEELVDIAEQSGSAPVYPLLKRTDERFVTIRAYENPVFVEDMVRNVVGILRNDSRIAWARVSAVNHESIHNHGAFASVEWSEGKSRDQT